MNNNYFIEIDHFQKYKQDQLVGGDTFLSQKIKDENRVISVLSDGLGSGVKANVLSTLTATMALKYVSNNFDIKKTARVIMRTLPVCKTRRIAYSTFTIVDIDRDGNTHIVEYDNPPFILIRDNKIKSISRSTVQLKNGKLKESHLHFSKFKAEKGDRLILFSDGVTQSGIGTKSFPLGWGLKSVQTFIESRLQQNSSISAREIAKDIVQKAYALDKYHALDDITCGVVNFRRPRKLLVMTGPPIDRTKDVEMAEVITGFQGKKIICGGTTAKIISRELDRKITVNIKDFDLQVPPTSTIDGINLVTEGTITMGKVAEILEKGINPESLKSNGATAMVNHLLNSDIIHFIVGTKINDAHQDPNVPVELEIRRNIIKKIVHLLEEKYLKETKLQFI